jgi:hydrogenase/urease accessory protein HupE
MAVILTLCGALSPLAGAHEVRPAYLELRETAPDTYDILWKVAARGGNERLAIYVRFPADAEPLEEPRGTAIGGAYLERWRVRRPGGLAGQTISVDGLAATDTDVLVRLERADRSTQTARLLPSRPSFVVEAAATWWSVAGAYLRLGVEHILGGVDHLLFVLALLLLVKGWKRLVGTVTAFTVAHSITLAAAALGFVHVPSPPVEACIALSILLLACEIVRAQRGQECLAARWPWVVAFTFGLLHGLGFASALIDVGLPQRAVPLALLAFNIGVEVGQLAFIAAVLGAIALVSRARNAARLRRPALLLATNAIGGLAAFWIIERLARF